MDLPKRKPNRLSYYDYSQYGAYFITICTKEKQCTLSSILPGDVFHPAHIKLSPVGKIVEQRLMEMNEIYSNIKIEKYVIMPNHLHIILFITESTETSTPANAAIPSFISTIKRFANKQSGIDLWQRSYHDHVIRNDSDFQMIWEYIENNPEKWCDDCFYPHNP